MEVLNLGKKIIGQLLVMIFIITACTPSDVPSRQNINANRAPGGSTPGNGNGAYPGENDLGNGTSLPPKVEIRHLIEPNLYSDPNYSTGTGATEGGSYVRKLTLPKNFAGKLYIAGINISSLAPRHVRVRFKFGMNKEAVTLPATVVEAPGITPQTPISVLVLDLRGEPFRNVRLPYDLFDYNEYSFDQPASTPIEGMLTEPVQKNTNTGLYCRGLKLEDDPTFTGVGACDGKENNTDQPAEECLYAYAKVADQGLIHEYSTTTGLKKVPLSPTLPQVMTSAGTIYLRDAFSNQLKKPLADTMPKSGTNFTSFTFSQDQASSQTLNMIFGATWAGLTVGTSKYYYRGPYRLVDTRGWQFRFKELDGPKGLFKENSWVNFTENTFTGGPAACPNSGNARCLPDDPVFWDYDLVTPKYVAHSKLYYNSLMFPRATKLSIAANVPHLSSDDPVEGRSSNTTAPGETTQWMDGSNARAQSINNEFNHIGSCNVSATIEIIAADDNNVDFVVAQSKDVKLQLVRPTQYRTDVGNEVLYTNFKTCTSNNQCGGSECCFNSRCWDEALVSQCFDDSATQGNREVGQSCTTDLECTSLCCNRTTGQCAPHNTSLSPAVLCSKPVGEFCIAKEWCQKYPITKRLIIKLPPDAQGNPQCTAYDYQVQEYGDCRNSVCVPPVQESLTPFDENAPGACNNAVPAPRF